MSDRYYSSDEEEFYIRRQGRAPDVRYATRPQQPAFLVPEQLTTVISRNRSRDRSRERSRDGRAGPIIINNNIDHSDFSDSDDGKGYKRRHHRHRSSSAQRPRGRNEGGALMSRADWEAEETRKQLEQLRLAKERDEEEYRLEKELREDEELRSTRRKLHEIQKRESRAEMEKRIKEEIEFERLQKEKKEKAEKERREREAKEAVELYKLEETQRKAKARQKEEDEEKAYRSRLEDDLIKAGLDEKYRNKILNNERIGPVLRPGERPVYTRMLKRHLSIETLREFHVEYDLDPDNGECIIVKRHVDEWERKQFWKHTKYIRERRKTIIIEDKHRHRSKPKLEVVVRKEKRSRSKSPGPLLMYLAGAR